MGDGRDAVPGVGLTDLEVGPELLVVPVDPTFGEVGHHSVEVDSESYLLISGTAR
jgi:hypothetical protein